MSPDQRSLLYLSRNHSGQGNYSNMGPDLAGLRSQLRKCFLERCYRKCKIHYDSCQNLNLLIRTTDRLVADKLNITKIVINQALAFINDISIP
jgi:hypothetical protein